MTRLVCVLAMVIMANGSNAQNILRLRILDKSTGDPMEKASILRRQGTPGLSDATGLVILNAIPDGKQSFQVHFVGFRAATITLDFPRAADTVELFLERNDEELDQIVVSSTRSSRTIRNIPTRVEVLNGEELEEKANMKPGDIRMMLNESTGIQTQQISVASANSGIRIQGLDGRYTQILKDGFPLFSGFSGGLGLLQTPPLDLQQVEIIKGSASTLYGGGAIAGLVNLVSKVPHPERELRFLLNGTSARGGDFNVFYSQRWKKTGLTLYAGENINGAYNPAEIIFSAIPQFNRTTINPRFFLYLSPQTTLTFGLNGSVENRIGGDMNFLRGKGDDVHRYFERNKSNRVSLQTSLDHQFDAATAVHLKISLNRFQRIITIPDYVFDGMQWSGYAELAFNHKRKKTEWSGGVNVYTDDFKEHPSDTFPKRNYSLRTFGGFLQASHTVASWLETEAGMRIDYTERYRLALLPRVSALIKYSSRFTSRIGGGLGYKSPTIFTEDAERIQFRSLYPVSPVTNALEKSSGLNLDFNYRVTVGRLGISLNQLFFFTRVRRPLLLDSLPGNRFILLNHRGFMDSKGFETNLKLTIDDFKLFVGYTFTDAHLKEDSRYRENFLTARHRLNNVLVYEKEGRWKAGLEAYYYSRQPLSDGKYGKDYWTYGIMAEKIGKRVSVFINFENITDIRQTRFDTIYTGTVSNPKFRDIYAPLDGFIANGGVKLRL